MIDADAARGAPQELVTWLTEVLGQHIAPSDLVLVAGDASPRRYFRMAYSGQLAFRESLIAMVSPATENNEAFIAIRKLLAEAGIKVPELLASNLESGFFLLEDFGDILLSRELLGGRGRSWYSKALSVFRQLVAIDMSHAALPAYDARLLLQEMHLFPQWFLGELLGFDTPEIEEAPLDRVFNVLVQNALRQPQVVVHRDFHSRNLMCLPDDCLGVIDFQDAVIGPITYDLVSLLKDCYVIWPREVQLEWLQRAFQQVRDVAALSDVSFDAFTEWFDLMGLQRHIKVLGIFARLYLRDGKPQYLNDLPAVLEYVSAALAMTKQRDPTLQVFADWFEGSVMPRAQSQTWFHRLT